MFIVILIGSVIIMHCSSSTGPEPDNRTELEKLLELTPRIDREAELAAMWLSDELVAPESLYLAIRDGYSQIRSKYSQTIPKVEEAVFFYNRDVSTIRFYMTDEGLDEIRNGTYTSWDSLNEIFSLIEIDTSGILFTNYNSVKLIFNGRLNPDRLVEYYDSLDGLEYATRSLIYTLFGSPQNFLPWIVDDKLVFLVNTPEVFPMEGDGNHFWYFKYVDDNYELIGDFSVADSIWPEWWDEIRCAHINFNYYSMDYCDSIDYLYGE